MVTSVSTANYSTTARFQASAVVQMRSNAEERIPTLPFSCKSEEPNGPAQQPITSYRLLMLMM